MMRLERRPFRVQPGESTSPRLLWFLFCCSTSGPPIWPGSTFFKRNGALLQGRSLGAPPPTPRHWALVLVAARGALSSSGEGTVWRSVTAVGWDCLSSSLSFFLLTSPGCYELLVRNQDWFFGLPPLALFRKRRLALVKLE